MHVYLIRLHEIRGDGDRCVVLGGFRADADAHDVVTRTDDALRPEQPERELEVVARCAHHDAERSAVERDLEGLLGRDLVALLAPGARALERLSRGRFVVASREGEEFLLPGAEGERERWKFLPFPESREAWSELRAKHEADGVAGLVLPNDPRLLDLIRNPDVQDDRADLKLAFG